MRKLAVSVGILLVAGIALLFTVRHWVFRQTLCAIDAATGAKVECMNMQLSLLSGQIRLQGLTVTAQRDTGVWERMHIGNATGQLCWREWDSGTIPLEIGLDDCEIQLRPIANLRLPDGSSLAQNTPVNPAPDGTKSSPTQQDRITLTTVTAKNVSILRDAGQPPYVAGINCNARRTFAGWQGSLTVERLGDSRLLLEQVQVDFSNEQKRTRIAGFQCGVGGGAISGRGWLNNNELAAIDLEVSGVQIAAIAPSWCGDAISGKASGTFSFTGFPVQWESGSLVGKFALTDAALKLGGVSQAIKLLSGGEVGEIALDTASGTLTMEHTKWALSGLTLEKRGVVGIYGDLACDEGTILKANLKLGVADNFLPRLVARGGEITEPQTGEMKWTTLEIETTPQALLATALAKLIQPNSQGSIAHPTDSPQKKTKSPMDAVLNFLTR